MVPNASDLEYKLFSVLEYATGQDVAVDIAHYRQAAEGKSRAKLDLMRDYAAYGIAFTQRFLPHGIAALGLERLIEGKYGESAAFLIAASAAFALERSLSRAGNTMSRAHAVVDYLIGADIVEYIKIYEPLVRKLRNRDLPSKGMDYWIHLKMFGTRLAMVGLELDGVRRIVGGDYKIGALELAAGIYKNLMDYRHRGRRNLWIDFYRQIEGSGLLSQIADADSRTSRRIAQP